MTTKDLDIKTIINDAHSIDYDNKKDIASKYGIKSNKAGEIKSILYGMANESHRGHSEFTEDDFDAFNYFWDVPESPQKIRKSMIDESIEFIKFYRDMKIKTCRNKYRRSYTTTISVLNAIIEERQESTDTILISLVNLLNKQTTKFHDSYIDMILKYEDHRFEYLKDRFNGISSMADLIHKFGDQGYKINNKLFKEMQSAKRETSDFNKDLFMKSKRQYAEMQFDGSIRMIAQRIKTAGMKYEDVKVMEISSNDAKAFDIHVTDGTRSMHARSIFCAEYSVYVSPHYRFIITNE